MDKIEKELFAGRFNEALDDKNFPPKGKNRQRIVGQRYGASQQAARRWLEGESVPSLERCIVMAKDLDVRFEWFMTGRGNKPFDHAEYEAAIQAVLDYQQKRLLEMFNGLIEDQQADMIKKMEELTRINQKIFTEMGQRNRKPDQS